MEYCDKCKTETYFKEIRRFPIPNGKKIWVSCEKCNSIKVRVIKQ
jgi:RNase P subunit RPR2